MNLSTHDPTHRITGGPCRSGRVRARRRRKSARDLALQSWVEDQQHLIARLDLRVRLGHEAATRAQYRDDQRAVRQRQLLDLLTRRLRTLGDLELDDLEMLLLERKQLDKAV